MASRLPSSTITALHRLRPRIERAKTRGNADLAVELLRPLKKAFDAEPRHFRLLKAELLIFDTCIDANELHFAESGILSVRQRANKNTRIYIEATALLAVCYVRLKRFDEAKPLVRETMLFLNNIKTVTRRRQFQKRFIERIEDETILAELIVESAFPIEPERIRASAIELIQTKSEEEILRLAAEGIPSNVVLKLQAVRRYLSENVEKESDVKNLPPPPAELPTTGLGKRVFSVIGRICWKTLCAEDSPVYKTWYNGLPERFEAAFLPAAVASGFQQYKIASTALAAGICATAMRYAAVEFCDATKPASLMIGLTDKN